MIDRLIRVVGKQVFKGILNHRSRTSQAPANRGYSPPPQRYVSYTHYYGFFARIGFFVLGVIGFGASIGSGLSLIFLGTAWVFSEHIQSLLTYFLLLLFILGVALFASMFASVFGVWGNFRKAFTGTEERGRLV